MVSAVPPAGTATSERLLNSPPPEHWLSDGAPVSGSPLRCGVPVPSGGLRQCWPEGRARVAGGVASARPPSDRARPVPGPLGSWPPAPKIRRSPPPNRFGYPAAPTLCRKACAASPTWLPRLVPYPGGPPHGHVHRPARLATESQNAMPDHWPAGRWLGVRTALRTLSGSAL